MPLSNAYKQEKPLTFVKVFFDQIHFSIAIFFCIMALDKKSGLFLLIVLYQYFVFIKQSGE